MKTAIQQLHDDLMDSWSSPGDLWRPDKIIEKVESMIELEKKQIIDAYYAGTAQFANDAEIVNPKTPEEYYKNLTGRQ